jgi:hypothetical protein
VRGPAERMLVLRPHLEHGVPLARAATDAGVPIRTARRWLAAYPPWRPEISCMTQGHGARLPGTIAKAALRLFAMPLAFGAHREF